jgi:hypothetical protein
MWSTEMKLNVNASEINALPDKIREYIHDLETWAGDVQTIASQKEQINALCAKIDYLRSDSYWNILSMIKERLALDGTIDRDFFDLILRTYNVEL